MQEARSNTTNSKADDLDHRLSIIEQAHDAAARNGMSVKFSIPGDTQSNIHVQRESKLFVIKASHAIYAGDLVRQFDYYFDSTIPDLKNGLQVVDYSTPRWHDLPSGERMFYTSFAEDIGATKDYIDYLRPAPGETVLDIGAYCGYSVLAFSRAVGPTGKVYAFEPDPNNFVALQTNILEAQASNVDLRNLALSSVTGTILFSSEGNMGSSIIKDPSTRGATVEVPSERLRSLFESGEITTFDVAKIDIEGAEYALLEDSIDIIRKTKARWAVEMHADPVTKEGVDVDRIRAIFDHLGYVSYLQPASSTAAAPTLFAFPDDRFPVALAARPEETITKQQQNALRASFAQLEAAHSALDLAHNRRRGSFGHRLRFVLTGK